MKLKLFSAASVAAFAAFLTVTSAVAQVGPPPPPAVAADTADHGGNKYKFGTAAWMQLGATVVGDAILYAGDAKPSDYWIWNIGSAVAGTLGGGGGLALFQEDDGLVTNLVNGTFKCQPGDKRDRCKIWVQEHPVKFTNKKKR